MVRKFNEMDKINEDLDINQFKSMIEFKLYQKFKDETITIDIVRDIISFFENDEDFCNKDTWQSGTPTQAGIYVVDDISGYEIVEFDGENEWTEINHGQVGDEPDKWMFIE